MSQIPLKRVPIEKPVVVAHVTQALGGVEIVLRTILRHLDDRKFRCHVIAPAGRYGFLTNSGKKVRVHSVPFIREINPLMDLKALMATIYRLKIIRPHIVHAHSSKGGMLGRLAGRWLGIPTLYTPHAFAFLGSRFGFKESLYRFLERIARRCTTMLVACSESERPTAIEQLGFRSEHTRVLPNALDPLEFAPGYPPVFNFPYFCTLSRPSYQKNPRMLVNLLQVMKRKKVCLKCVLVGIGHFSPLSQKLKEDIHRYDLERDLILVEWSDRPTTMAILAHCLCYVSTSRYEGLPLAVLEAMALGKAVVATDVAGNQDCVQHGKTGFLVPLDDAARVAQYIEILMLNQPCRQRMEAEARRRFRTTFDITAMISKMEELYLNVAKPSHHRHGWHREC